MFCVMEMQTYTLGLNNIDNYINYHDFKTFKRKDQINGQCFMIKSDVFETFFMV